MGNPTIAASLKSSFRIDCNFDLPTIPVMMSRILRVLDDETASARKMEELILHDQSLSARILKFANSPLYAFRSEVKTISHAITLLGLNLVRSLAIGMSIFNSFTRGARSEAAHLNNLWMHSYGVGVLSQKIWGRRSTRKDAEFAFLCGLLHDLGKVVYFKKATTHYSYVFAQDRSGEQPCISTVEQEYYGISHAPLGAILAERWGFPAALCTVIRRHHSAPDQNAPIVAAVSLADSIVRQAGIGYDGDRRANPEETGPQAVLNCGEEELEQLRSFAEARRKEIEDFFRLVS
ncbi:MAG: HDOD domain-containing protein [Acidobacteria bacterium]|nr:HDOD domain-containing protein [Acidobacteriota bacterium]